MKLHEFLQKQQLHESLSTEDVLASFLPVLREAIAAHAAGLVAPLEGLEALQVEGARIWFEEARRQPIRRNDAELARIEQVSRVAVEVVSESRRTHEVADGQEEISRVEIGVRGATLERPVYLPGYVAWEHELAHHDPLTDVYSLGLLLASVACGLDLNDPAELESFVANRRNLFVLNPHLHPVLAQAILRMTELDRQRRPQDLPAVLLSLENYREQTVAFEIDLLQGLKARQNATRSQAVLSKLKERLFDISRRNNLLSFRPTAGTLNLTQASIPLLIDIRRIRDDQILIWSETLRKQLADGKPISLNKHLNFAEALYLPSILERVITEARRDQQEYGFAQLRLVVCFLSWANLKVKPPESFVSPLVLVPVKLTKTKGIRDTFALEAVSSEAEVNPVLRHQFKQLYDIDLPESVDLAEGGLEKLLDYLTARIRSSEPAVTVERIDRPRIDLIHEKARRRLDQFRKGARISGRGIRHFLNLDYSYDPVNYHPLGIKLFAAKVRTPTSRLREIIEERPRPRSYVAPEPAPDVVETERSFYSVRDSSEANPYLWNFDLCSLTLANFRYRRMSLVRDYEAIHSGDQANPAFEATFSLIPKPVGRELPAVPPLAERFDVVPCDPTQSTAIAEARRGASYIIQGPPGTGKSQTITNLIADFIARGQRVLFVCEKRAAIDVVFARLRQCGLGSLCALIHDSQTDKKDFVMDLKQSYERLLEPEAEGADVLATRRQILQDIERQLQPLARFAEVMEESYEPAAMTGRGLLDQCLSLRVNRPELTPEEYEQLPRYRDWWPNRDRFAALESSLRDLRTDGVLARHPLRLLSPRLADAERPIEVVNRHGEQALDLFAKVRQTLQRSGIEAADWNSLERARQLVDYASQIEPFASRGNLPLLAAGSAQAKDFAGRLAELEEFSTKLASAQQLTTAWRSKLPAADLASAIEQVRSWEGKFFAWLAPAWWRMRGVLSRCYDFGAHAIRPTWLQVLTNLQHEYNAQLALAQAQQRVTARFNLGEMPGDVGAKIGVVRGWLARQPEWIARIQQGLLDNPQAAEVVERILLAQEPLTNLEAALDTFAVDYSRLPLDQLQAELTGINQSARQVPQALALLNELGQLPPAAGRMLREVPLTLAGAEAAVAHRTWDELCRSDRTINRFTSRTRERSVQELEQSYGAWLRVNADEICRRVKEQFREHIAITNTPADKLTAAQKDFKRAYNQGRRTLEHEFGKSMRYKPIRELVDGEPGQVVRDLKPVWLMSPLSVSDTLPLDTNLVDVVIFDEASQVPLEEAVPSLFRGKQTIVVGDEMQLPPTDFFATKTAEEEATDEAVDPAVRVDLASDSFLNHAAKNLPATMLGWHYRSRSESLISFSNWAFYDGRLLTVPDERLPVAPVQQTTGCDLLLSQPLSFHLQTAGVYDNRRNRVEAEYTAQLVADLLRRQSGLSIGVIAFSEAQQNEILAALDRLAEQDDDFRQLYDAELQREVDGQFVGLLVKNLENIQGDERDVIILSVCYGPPPGGKMLMNFGPINQSGGEKRLNVAFSRAKQFMAIVTSIRHQQITNDYNRGAGCLKNYLRYAEAISLGDVESGRRVLAGISRWQDSASKTAHEQSDPLTQQIALALRQQGYQVDCGVGQSHFRVDLAVWKPGDAHYRLGILTDTLEHYEQSEPLERDMMRPRLLRDFGWQVTSILAKDWYENQAAELERLHKLLNDAPAERR